ncbi:MAG TPA: hypothetical protein DEQ17_00565 [Prevotella sp.]|nr:hypothetical protein [Prevotella sp.]
MNEDWTKDIQRLMADRRVKAPDGLLEDVKQRLASSSPVVSPKSIRPAQNVTMWRYRWLTAAAVAAAIAVPVTWRLLKVDESPRVVAVSRAVQRSANRANASLPLDGFATKPEMAMLSKHDETTPWHLHMSDEAHVANNANVETVGEAREAALGQSAQMAENEEKGRSLPESRGDTKSGKHSSRDTYQYQAEADYAYGGSSPVSSPLTLTAYYGGAFSGNGLAANRGISAACGYYSDEMPFGTFPMQLGKANVMMAKRPKRKSHHAQPVKVGVSLGYRLSDRWAVNTGVTYSYLSSNFTEDVDVVDRQKLHYVGVPLTASYSFLRTKRAEVYVTAGGEVEKLVKGSTGLDDSEPQKLTEKRPQWSVKAAVGGAFHFTPSLSLYAEPGVTHYFDNHSSVDNVYKDRPTSFSLNVGLRFNVK